MLSVILVIIFALAVIWCNNNREHSLHVMLAYSIVSPSIVLFGMRLDSMYVMDCVLLIVIILSGRSCILIPREFFRYYTLIAFVFFIYLVAWVIFNRNNSIEMMLQYTGCIRWLVYFQFCYQLNDDLDKNALIGEIRKMLILVTFLNVAFVIIQRGFPSIGYDLLKSLKSDATYYYLNLRDTFNDGGFRRCFGIMDYPMSLGCFSVMAFAFTLVSNEKKALDYLIMIANIFTGILSSTKSFYVGFLAISFIVMIFSFYFNELDLKRSIGYTLMFTSIIIIGFLMFDKIYLFLFEKLGANYAYYWSVLRDRSEIFRARYSADRGFYSYMSEFLKDYWYIGVGPVSRVGESTVDSAYLSLLHSRGFIALITVLIFYIKRLIRFFGNKDLYAFSLIVLLMSFGVGFNTLIVSDNCMWVLFFILMTEVISNDPLSLEGITKFNIQ